MSDRAMPIRWEIATLALITLLAAGLRLYRLPDIPPGLHFDEGFKGVTARALLDGAPPQLFFERDMGEEPLAIYLVAAALTALGPDPVDHPAAVGPGRNPHGAPGLVVGQGVEPLCQSPRGYRAGRDLDTAQAGQPR